jgi:hypothetical protein
MVALTVQGVVIDKPVGGGGLPPPPPLLLLLLLVSFFLHAETNKKSAAAKQVRNFFIENNFNKVNYFQEIKREGINQKVTETHPPPFLQMRF